MMDVSRIQFGTDGWRALLGSEINADSIAVVAQAFMDALPEITGRETGEIVIGYDGRESSAEFAAIFETCAAAHGWASYLSPEVVPTPVVSFNTLERGAQAGVMITASHNPTGYNGIKFKSASGSPFSAEMTQVVEQHLGHHPFMATDGLVHTTDLWEPYGKHLERMIDFAAIREAGLKVAIDSMAGAGARRLETILRDHGIEATTIDGEPRPDFNSRQAEPIEANLQPLREFLASHPGYSIGLATDGDADRLGVCLEDGSWQNAQETILLLSHYLLVKRGDPGALVKTASVTKRLEAFAHKADRSVINVQVGFKYVAEEMERQMVAFGAEESGGFGIGVHMPERDGIFSGLTMLELLAHSGHTRLSDLVHEIRLEVGDIHYRRIDIPTAVRDNGQWLNRLAEIAPGSIAGYSVTGTELFKSSRGWINGLKFHLEGEARWLLLRSSETEPLVRVYAEGDRTNEPVILLQAGRQLFKDAGVDFKDETGG